MFREEFANNTFKYELQVEKKHLTEHSDNTSRAWCVSSSHVPGVSVLVSDHFGSLTGGKLLENLKQLEVVHLGG